MIDYQRSLLPLTSREVPKAIWKGYQLPCTWNGLVMRPTEGKRHCATKKSLASAGLKGLHIVLTWGLEPMLQVSQSPHKFLKGNNVGDFNRTDMIEFISLVSERLQIPFWDAAPFGKIEISVNINEDNPKQLIRELASYKLKPLDNMRSHRKTYGKKNETAYIQPKIYNPHHKEVLMGHKPSFDEDRIRIECISTVGNLRKVGIDLTSMAQYTETNTLDKMGSLLCHTMKEITFKSKITATFSESELAHYYFFVNAPQEVLEAFKSRSRRTFYRWREDFKKVSMKAAIRPNDLPERTAQKWILLSAS